MTRELHAVARRVVFLFGLLHGLGFAGVLRELGLPRSEFLTALLSFNVGRGVGQLTVIAIAALILWPAMRRAWVPPAGGRPALYLHRAGRRLLDGRPRVPAIGSAADIPAVNYA